MVYALDSAQVLCHLGIIHEPEWVCHDLSDQYYSPYVGPSQAACAPGPPLDGPWEKYAGNPIIMDLANNWTIGHGDLVIVGPATYLYTATSQTTRGRYVLVRR